MAARETRKTKTLKDRAQEFVQGVAEALGALLPEPQLMPVPVPVRGNQARPQPRRRR